MDLTPLPHEPWGSISGFFALRSRPFHRNMDPRRMPVSQSLRKFFDLCDDGALSVLNHIETDMLAFFQGG